MFERRDNGLPNGNNTPRSILPPRGLTNEGVLPDEFAREVSVDYDDLKGIDELQRKDNDKND
ncbi:hypothetical protein [Alkalihalobacillus sp. AL-G]|uniref:hypothetical protein n=1 Tax=Alkalihalobacillus sp. AL-G TaxID=2926399 RepID=UPI00272B5353|nr:hypothetical protein [Alkalihalobacillus sp. AL-G]WLD94514.1 hypothetical protein MOJ78_06405 [Alkalihalobacillus sp. AL-G]